MKQGRLREILEDLSLNRVQTTQERIKRIDTAIKQIADLLPKKHLVKGSKNDRVYWKDVGCNLSNEDCRKALGIAG